MSVPLDEYLGDSAKVDPAVVDALWKEWQEATQGIAPECVRYASPLSHWNT